MTDVFRFKNFEVAQQPNVFKIGTDGVLLGLKIPIKNVENILEIGSGCGVISLILAQRSQANITAIDIDENAFKLAEYNFLHSPFSTRMNAIFGDIRTQNFSEKFDLIVCNPPFFNENSTAHQAHTQARQQISLSYKELIVAVEKNLRESGKATVIIPFDDVILFEETLKKLQFHTNKKTIIYGIINGKPKRCIIEFSHIKTKLLIEDFYIEKSPRQYTEAYKNLGKDFYLGW